MLRRCRSAWACSRYYTLNPLSSCSPLISKYSEQHSTLISDLALDSMLEHTERVFGPGSTAKCVSRHQAQCLYFMARLLRPRRALELGCFAGLSSAAIAAAMAHTAREPSLCAHVASTLVICDKDARAVQVAQEHLCRFGSAELDIQVHCQDAKELLKQLACAPPFDFIFVDANKKANLLYYQLIMNHRLLSRSGLLLVDNTLFKGHVANMALTADARSSLVAATHEFNEFVARDVRVLVTLLPLFDGLSMIQHQHGPPVAI